MLQILQHTTRRGAICLCVVCKQPYEVDDRFTAQKVHAGDQCDTCKHLPNNPPTQSLLLQLFDYNPQTGRLSYKRDFYRRVKGDDPTSVKNTGYSSVTLDKQYLAHRLIWLMQTGTLPKLIDHIDHNRTNNAWDNLRQVDDLGNAQNKSVNRNNTSGYLGVSYMKALNKYRASITLNHKHVHLGVFDTAEAANAARLLANQAHSFHTNHGTLS